ncbi:DUF2225 domain-containing protein [Lachnotalea glycerini]|uniref:DUF2225 domain-containing protein n=1 Tax=Lachnotalea glycerini TaxID=1763509 RepID=A0A371JF46_9FIRM|nr:DUF2225 domain-containing protein [Lachnotalea glycerini]RDY31382.1 DUF2225 domain-containing protein [Lachnotalea glycerini]
MANLLSGLEKFGLGNFEDEKIFEDEKKAEAISKGTAVKETAEEDLLFDKTYQCPVCDKEFKSKTVRTGKAKLLGTDIDLRAKYQGIDPLKYDIVSCPKCGYTTVTRYFNLITSPQASLIREKISRNYKASVNNESTISYEAAIESHKLALVNAIVKKCRVSEKAYICLKIAWLIRGQREDLDETANDYKDLVTKSETEELEFIKNAYEGFSAAVAKEEFPMCGMDESTMDYLLAALACQCKQYDMASRLVSNVITSRVAKNNLKEKARELKTVILQERKDN